MAGAVAAVVRAPYGCEKADVVQLPEKIKGGIGTAPRLMGGDRKGNVKLGKPFPDVAGRGFRYHKISAAAALGMLSAQTRVNSP